MGIVKSGSFVVAGEVGIDNKVLVVSREQETIPEKIPETEPIVEEIDKSSVLADLEQMKKEYTEEALRIIKDAEARAQETLQKAREDATKLVETAREQSTNLRHTAQQEGFSAGYADGEKHAKDEVNSQGQELLNSAKALLEQIQAEKEQLFTNYENDIFETVLEIANKVTLDSISQKDSRIIAKIIKQAAKNFRNSKFLKISLAKDEITTELAADPDFVEEIAAHIPHIEIELLKEAEAGTVILDDGNEITDASVSTQLKMITELGRGKYKKPLAKRILGDKENV